MRKALFYQTFCNHLGQRWCYHHSTTRQTTILLFPGQGSQFVGMTKELTNNSAVQNIFKTANEVLGYDLWYKCLHGESSELDKTVYCQPAILAATLAAVEKYKETLPESYKKWYHSRMTAAGFSVGEYASLVLSEALTIADAFKLIDARARGMQAASEKCKSAMITVTGLNKDEITDLIDSTKQSLNADKILNIANTLYGKGFVLAGHEEAIQYVLKFAIDKYGATKVTRLRVSGAFHTPIMEPAKMVFGKAIATIDIKTPIFTVYSNVTGRPYTSSDEIRRLLPRQLVEPVQWYRTMVDICENHEQNELQFIEMGPGKHLTAVLSKINRKLVKRSQNIEI